MKLTNILWSPVKEGETWALTFVRVSGNLLRWVLVFPLIILALIGAGIWAYHWYENRPTALHEMDGFELGMTPDEVTVAKGSPERRTDIELRDGGKYEFSMVYRNKFLYFSGETDDSFFVRRVCDTQLSAYRSYNGLDKFDPEDEIIKKLGFPDRERVHDDKLGKAMTFDRWNMIVHLEAGSISAICVGV